MMNELKFGKDQIKRIILPTLLLLSIGDKKIIIKSPKLGEKKHYTLGVSEEGYIDIHETVELEKKVHTSIAKVKIEQFADAIQENIPDVRTFEIDLNDRRYMKYRVLIPKYPGADEAFMKSLSTLKRRNLIIDLKQLNLRRISEFFYPIRFSQIQRHDFERAYAFHPKKQSWIMIFRVGGDYHAFSSGDFPDFRERALKTILSTFVYAAKVNAPPPP